MKGLLISITISFIFCYINAESAGQFNDVIINQNQGVQAPGTSGSGTWSCSKFLEPTGSRT